MKIETRRLENGLHVFLVHIPSARTVCTVFRVRAGWRYERKGFDVGVAHFLEHENFRGTPRRPTSRDISIEIESGGGRSNAFTNPESICYFVHMPTRHAELSVDIVSDMIMNPLFEEEVIELERGAVKEEYKGVLANPESFLSDILLSPLVFGDNPLGWVGTGTDEEIARIDRNVLCSYMEDLFTGPNSVVVCAGNIQDTNRIFEIIAKGFGRLPSHSPRRRRKIFIDDQVNLRLRIVEKEIEHALVGITFKQSSARNRYALGILETILGQGMSSRLFLNVRDNLGLTYDIYTDLGIHPDVVTLSIFAGFDLLKWKDGLKAIIEELRSLRQKIVSEDELAKAKEMMVGDIEFALEQPSGLALGLSESWSLYGKVRSFDHIEKAIRAVSASRVASVAERLFRADKLNCVVLGASPSEEEEARAILSALN